MGRRRATLAAGVTIAALTVPAPATAALPQQGRFVKRDQAKGLYMETTRHTIRTLWLFCRRADYDQSGARTEYRAARFEVPHPLHVRRNGTFSFSGYGRRFGPEGQFLGNHWRMRVTGRFTSRRHVRITRALKGCATRTVTARRTRGL